MTVTILIVVFLVGGLVGGLAVCWVAALIDRRQESLRVSLRAVRKERCDAPPVPPPARKRIPSPRLRRRYRCRT